MIEPDITQHDSEHVEYELETEMSTEEDVLAQNDPNRVYI